jgi:catechol 1,2-dioxygenase
MKRREFTKLAGLSALAVSTTGFIQFNGEFYEGDCETTTDVLGPFYRPNSPLRKNLVIEGAPGDKIELSGIVRHKDCQAPYENAKVELWHCSSKGVYDNESDQYQYRGTTFCDADGKYRFITQMPVPYGDETGYRPAHFHLMISAAGFQSLITQIYFTGDPYLEKDGSSASAEAKSRILEINEVNGIKRVSFDCNMNERLKASFDALEKIVGLYKNDDSGESLEFFKKGDLLWLKNEVFGEKYDYVGNNEFELDRIPMGLLEKLHFDLQKDGRVICTKTDLRKNGNKTSQVFFKG